MIILAIFLVILGLSRIYSSFTKEDQFQAQVNSTNLPPTNIDPETLAKILMYMNAIVGFIEAICGLYIIYK